MAKSRKKQNRIALIIIVLLIAGAVWYLSQPAQPVQPTTPQESPVEEKPGVKTGDLVAINFVLTLANGTVVDTNNKELAEQYGLKTYTTGPFRFVVGQSGKVKGFDEALLGMTLNEHRKKIIPPSEQVLKHELNRTRSISRNHPISRYQPIPIKTFEKLFQRKPQVNDVVVKPGFAWPFKVINTSEDWVITEPLVEEGKSYQLPGFEWKSTLLIKTADDMMFRHNPEEGQIIQTDLGPAKVNLTAGRINIISLARLGDVFKYAPQPSLPTAKEGATALYIAQPYDYQVTEASDEKFTITRINYPPQETLVLEADLLEWIPEVKEIKKDIKQGN